MPCKVNSGPTKKNCAVSVPVVPPPPPKWAAPVPALAAVGDQGALCHSKDLESTYLPWSHPPWPGILVDA